MKPLHSSRSSLGTTTTLLATSAAALHLAISHVVTSAADNCRENKKITVASNYCFSEMRFCAKETLNKSYTVGVNAEGNLILVSAGTMYSQSWSFDVPNGCAAIPGKEVGPCARKTGQQETPQEGGSQNDLWLKECLGTYEATCIEQMVQMEIAVPNELVDALNALLAAGGDPRRVEYGSKLTVSVLDCIGNTDGAPLIPCPFPEGQSWYELSNGPCPGDA